MVEMRVEEFRVQQQELMADVSSRMKSFVAGELEKLSSTQAFLEANVAAFEGSEKEVSEQTRSAKDEMDSVLEEIKTLREDVKARVGQGLQGLSVAAERISAEVISELGAFHTQLHTSYSSLGRDFKSLFEDLLKHINTQKAEADELRQQLTAASEIAMQSNSAASSRLDEVLREEREQAAADRQSLLSQITSLVVAQGEVQDARLTSKISDVQISVLSSKETFEASRAQYSQRMDEWNRKEGLLVEEVLRSRENLKGKLKEDWVVSYHFSYPVKSTMLTILQAANKHNSTLQLSTKSVHDETVRIVDAQMKDIETQMAALDDFVTRARSQNAQHHDSHIKSLQRLSTDVKSSYSNVGEHFTATYERVRDLGDEMSAKTSTLQESLAPLDDVLRKPLTDLRENVSNTKMMEYEPTGETPQKVQYTYPTELPRTDAHENLLASLGRPTSSDRSPSKPSTSTSMVPVIFNDGPNFSASTSRLKDFSSSTRSRASITPDAHPQRPSTSSGTGLREVDANTMGGVVHEDNHTGPLSQIPSFKRSLSAAGGKLPVLRSGKKSAVQLEGRENERGVLGQSIGTGGRRRSPRTGS
jgi:kinesin family protein 11